MCLCVCFLLCVCLVFVKSVVHVCYFFLFMFVICLFCVIFVYFLELAGESIAPAAENKGNFKHGGMFRTNAQSMTISTTITATDTSIVLADGSEFPTSGYIVIDATDTDTTSLQYGKITSETIQYTGRSTNTLTGCTRGTAAPSYGETPVSTTAVAHTAGAKIYGSYEITKIDSSLPYAGEPSTLTVSNSFSFTLANAASSVETGGGFFFFGGPVNDRS